MRKPNLMSMTQQQRLTIASAAAVALHMLLFAGGWLLIQSISIPSNQNRVMVLTLNSTPQDGLSESENDFENTLNDAKQGEAASMLEQPDLSELSQLSTQSHTKPTFELEPEIPPQPLPEMEAVSHSSVDQSASQQVVVQETPAAPQFEDTPSEATAIFSASSDWSERVKEIVDLEALITASSGELQLKVAPPPANLETNEIQEVPPKQQRMLERKIQQWVSKQDLMEQVDQSYSWQHKGQTYVAKFTHLPAAGEMDLDEMMVEISTTQDGQALSTTVNMKKLAFSNFAQFVHRWDPSVMIHDDEMNGRFHSNSQILLASDRRTRPVFHGKVTTASYRVDFADAVRRSAKREIFKGGLETGVKRIRMPKPTMLFDEGYAADQDDTILFTDDARIIFTAEGGFMWMPTNEAGAPRYQVLGDHPIYLIAEPGVTLSISGNVLGKVMVYSPERVIIEDDLTYARDNFKETDDVIGVISAKDVVVAGQDMTGAGDLHIEASIYARRRFQVRDYSKPHTGTLRIYGSVSAGSVSATQPRYATSITFDKRFEELRPPGFPMTDRYESSEEEWSWQVSN